MPVALEAVRGALADRYAVIREIGSGGMATVYLATDLRHQRQVAVKVLRPELAAQAGAERFLREIAIAASLSHPNILPVHDSGEASGILYYVMPFLEGESLRDRLRRDHQLPIPEALRIVKEVSSGLSHAHAHGVVHRDIKPENLLFFGGQAVVADFGIARAVMGDTEGETALTSTGIVIGTPTYMSPEQATGGRDIDARSDVYSLGCVLYEMLAGDPPFSGGNPNAITARKLSDPVPRLTTVRETVSPALERTIERALAKSPADRFQSAEAMAAALEQGAAEGGRRRAQWPERRTVLRASIVTAVLVAVGVGAFGIRAFFRSRPPRFGRVAMLPLKVAGPDSIPSYLVEGLTEGLIGDLARLEKMDVIALASVEGFRDGSEPVGTAARRLGAAAIVSGTLRRDGDQLGLELRLSVPGQDTAQWTRSFRAPLAQPEQLARETMASLAGYLGARSTRPARAPSSAPNPAVQDLYLKGRYYLSGRSPEGFQNAVDYFRQALAVDPAHAPSYAGLAQYYNLLPFYSNAAPKESYDKAMAAAQKAVELDPTLPEGHAAVAYVKAFRDWDWAGARYEYGRALALRPSDADIHHTLSRLLAIEGDFEGSVREAERSHQLDPLSLTAHANIGVIFYFKRDYAEAARRLTATLQLDSADVTAHWGLGMVHEQLGQFKEAEAEIMKAIADGRSPNRLASLGHLYGVSGRRPEAEAILRELAAKTVVTIPYHLAVVQAGLGRVDDALTSLETAYERRVTMMTYAARDPRLDPLRASPRFISLLQRMNLTAGPKR